MSHLPEQLWSLSRSLYQKKMIVLARAVKTMNWAFHKCLLPYEAIVGENVHLEHHALGIVIHPQVTIGDNCRIFQHVSMAAETPIGSEHRIILGKDCLIGANAVIVSRKDHSLYIGDGSILGAGSVLTRDIAPNEVWAGNPARKLKDRPPGYSIHG